MRTASLRGHNGRNVAWDFTFERMNLEIATMLGHDISPGRIQEVIRQLNGIRHIRGAALNALGIGDTSEQSEYNGVLDTDIGQLVQYLKLSFSIDGDNDFAQLCSDHKSVPLGRRGCSLDSMMPSKLKERVGTIQTE
jgi:hypothetical protein